MVPTARMRFEMMAARVASVSASSMLCVWERRFGQHRTGEGRQAEARGARWRQGIRFTVPGADDARPVADLNLLERNKRALALDYYSVEGATLECVFLSAVRENNVPEEDGAPARRWRRWLFARR